MSTGLDFFDTVLLALLACICGVNVILLMSYTAGKFEARTKSAQNKADRPFWIVGCLASGSIWMIASLLLAGDFDIYSGNTYICILLKALFQYTFGYILWTNLIVYRLFRLYMVHAWIIKPLHAMAVLSLLQAPFLLYTFISLALNGSCIPRPDSNGYLTCTQSLDWNIALYTLAFSYLLGFVYLALKVRKVTGTFADLKRYIAFCGFSFLFLIFDASLNLSDSWTLITIRRFLCLFVFVIVAAQSWSIFWSVLLRKKLHKGLDNEDPRAVVMLPDESRPKVGALELTEDELLGGPIRRTTSISPTQFSAQHYSVRPGFTFAIWPREQVHDPFPLDTSAEAFERDLTETDRHRLPKGTMNLDFE
jgi:hypothetical protein